MISLVSFHIHSAQQQTLEAEVAELKALLRASRTNYELTEIAYLTNPVQR